MACIVTSAHKRTSPFIALNEPPTWQFLERQERIQHIKSGRAVSKKRKDTQKKRRKISATSSGTGTSGRSDRRRPGRESKERSKECSSEPSDSEQWNKAMSLLQYLDWLIFFFFLSDGVCIVGESFFFGAPIRPNDLKYDSRGSFLSANFDRKKWLREIWDIFFYTWSLRTEKPDSFVVVFVDFILFILWFRDFVLLSRLCRRVMENARHGTVDFCWHFLLVFLNAKPSDRHDPTVARLFFFCVHFFSLWFSDQGPLWSSSSVHIRSTEKGDFRFWINYTVETTMR